MISHCGLGDHQYCGHEFTPHLAVGMGEVSAKPTAFRLAIMGKSGGLVSANREHYSLDGDAFRIAGKRVAHLSPRCAPSDHGRDMDSYARDVGRPCRSAAPD